MKIKTKFLGIIYIFILVFCLSVLGLYYYLHSYTSKSIDNILVYRNKLDMLSQLELVLTKAIMPANDYLMHGKEKDKDKFEELDTNVNKHFSLFEKKSVLAYIMMEEREIIVNIRDQYFQIKTYSEMIFKLTNPIGNTEGAHIMEKMDLLTDNMLDSLKELHKLSRRDILVEVEAINTIFYRYIIVAIGILGVIIIILFFYGRFLAKGIISPVGRLVEYMKYVALGDFSMRLDIKTNDEIGLLSSSFNKMVEDLHETTVSKDYMNNIIKSMADTLVVITPDATIQTVNQAFCSLLGYKEEELIGKPIEMVIAKDLVLKRTRSGEVNRKSLITNTEEAYLSKDGREIPVLFSKSILCSKEGGINGILCVAVDITERKQSERRLNAQHAIIQVLAESTTLKEASPKIIQAVCMALEWDLGEIWIFDQQASVLRNTEIWHKSSLKLNEFKAATKYITFPAKIGLPGRVWESAQPLWIEDVLYDTKFLRASIAEREGLHGAFGFPIIIGSEVLGTICFFSQEIKKPDKDLLNMMTAIGRQIGLFIKRKQAEEALIQSDKLRALGMITSGIAHDFNNILAVISGIAQVLEMDNEDNKELVDRFRTIIKASDDGAEIVHRMRMFTKQEKGISVLLPVDIKSVLEQSIDFVKPRWMNIATAGGINYDIDKDGIMEVPLIMGNESELREVFINIMNNAMDAMEKGGCLSFCTWQNKKNIFISISDTGEGMSDEVKKRVFEPFYTTKLEKGSGLGMSMSFGIIERHGGSIEVKSEVGKATTFTLILPITVSPAQKTESPVEDHEIMAKGLSILVVDDKEDICSILEMFFANDGHTVKTADSGNMAIEVLKTETFDLVLCDLVMPDMSGHDVVAVLNMVEKKPKIGLMTGWSERLEAEDKNELNVDFIIKKPFVFSVLAGHINDAFSADSRR